MNELKQLNDLYMEAPMLWTVWEDLFSISGCFATFCHVIQHEPPFAPAPSFLGRFKKSMESKQKGNEDWS
ncbi:hypothetical protein QL285_042959 [Trifolium repens]|nr:hypothetical protein QL285_042959 [Trifolium repens]